MKVLVLNGPNLNLLGEREPHIYGSTTLPQLIEGLQQQFAGRVQIVAAQSNHEGELIDALHAARHEEIDGVVLNAGAYTHTSLALHDAIKAIAPLPVVEVHISNIHAREDMRHTSLIAAACRGIVAGFGLDSYRLAVEALMGLRA